MLAFLEKPDWEQANLLELPSERVARTCTHSYFPALPTFDRRVRYSGKFVRWFLTENRYWVERYRELLETAELAAILRVSPGALRRAARQPGFALPPKD